MGYAEGMILEGIVTTQNPDGSPRISPMGPMVDEALSQLEFRPYQTSTTFQNLVRTRRGVFHVTDDVELLARAAVDRLETPPSLLEVPGVEGEVLADACRWIAFEICEIDDRQPRARLTAVVYQHGRIRDFFGFNRAKHAVVEAAILATRVDFLPHEEIEAEMQRLTSMVEKTGGPAERRAFDFLRGYLHDAHARSVLEASPAHAATVPHHG